VLRLIMPHHAFVALLLLLLLQLAVKHYITIIESMTEKELDSTNVKIFQEPSRIQRLAIGSGAQQQQHASCTCHTV
jgi:signal recognition particle GTPase